MIARRDIDHFRTFGYVILRSHLSAAEMDLMRTEVQEAMTEAYADDPFDGTKRHWLPFANPRRPFMQSLLEDPRFHDVAQQLTGTDDLIVLTVDANRYVSDTPWHEDGGYGGDALLGVKYVAYLEPMQADRGALRLIPGSHREPYRSQVRDFLEAHPGAGPDVPAVICDTQPGDIVAFSFPTYHAAFGGFPDRRMCTIEFLEYPRTSGRMERMMATIAGLIQGHNAGRDVEMYPWFHPDWIANPAENRTRQGIIDRMRGLGIFDLAGATG